jgi:DNA mismatch repair ATPase MutL
MFCAFLATVFIGNINVPLCRMPPEDLDVNVHPTKKEVHFLHEEVLLQVIYEQLHRTLRASNDSRSLQVQTTLRFDAPSVATLGAGPRDPVHAAAQGKSVYASEFSTGAQPAVLAASRAPSAPPSAFLAGTETGQHRENPIVQVTERPGQVRNRSPQRFPAAGGIAGLELPEGRMGMAIAGSGAHSVRQSLELEDEEFEGDGVQSNHEDNYDVREYAGWEEGGDSSAKDVGDDLQDDVVLFQAQERREGTRFFGSNSAMGAKPGAHAHGFDSYRREGSRNTAVSSFPSAAKSAAGVSVAPQKLVRTDPSLVKITSLFKPAGSGSASTSSRAHLPSSASFQNLPDLGKDALCCECAVPMFPTPRERGTARPDGDDTNAAADAEDSETLGQKRLRPEADAMEESCLCCGLGSKRWRREDNAGSVMAGQAASGTSSTVRLPELVETRCVYESVRALIGEVKGARSAELALMLKAHTYVGTVDSVFSLVQHGTKLMLIDHANLLCDMMYQLTLRRFGELDSYVLSRPVRLLDFLQAALEEQILHGRASRSGEKLTQEEVWATAEKAAALLCAKAPLLEEYFSVVIDAEDGTLRALPVLIAGHTPALEALPAFLLSLCRRVNWEDEMECFRTVALAVAAFYSTLSTEYPLVIDTSRDPPGRAFPPLTRVADEMLRSLLYPAMRMYLIPHRARAVDHTVVQIAALEQLYKVFERC